MAGRHRPDSVPPPACVYPEPIETVAASQLPPLDQATHNRIVSFLWGIADDVLRDLFRRGKYPDVILPI
jgi:hypothetical protein